MNLYIQLITLILLLFTLNSRSFERFLSAFCHPRFKWTLLLSDLDNYKWSGPDFWRVAIKKFAIIKKFFYSIIILLKILVKVLCQSSSDVFKYSKTYLINKNIIKFNFNLTLLYYILKLSLALLYFQVKH